MLIEAIIVLATVYPILLIGKLIATALTSWRWAIPIMQTIVAVIVVSLFVEFTIISPVVAIVATFIPLTINLLVIISKRRQKEHALNGKYGKEVQWGAEIVEENDDQEFAAAIDQLPDTELMEVGIIAESKEELRELAVDRLEEYNK